jgi:hypothetical protein
VYIFTKNMDIWLFFSYSFWLFHKTLKGSFFWITLYMPTIHQWLTLRFSYFVFISVLNVPVGSQGYRDRTSDRKLGFAWFWKGSCNYYFFGIKQQLLSNSGPSTLLAIGFYPIGFELNLYQLIRIWGRIAIFITANKHLGHRVHKCLLPQKY